MRVYLLNFYFHYKIAHAIINTLFNAHSFNKANHNIISNGATEFLLPSFYNVLSPFE